MHSGGVRHPNTIRLRLPCRCVEDLLDLLNRLLLLDVGLSQSLEDLLFLLFQLSSFTVFLADLDDFLFDNFILLLADLSPLLRCKLISFLSDSHLLISDCRTLLLQFLELLLLLFLQLFLVFLSLHLDLGSLCIAQLVELLP